MQLASHSSYIRHGKGMGVLSQMLIAMLALFLLMDVDLLLGTEQAVMLHSINIVFHAFLMLLL